MSSEQLQAEIANLRLELQALSLRVSALEVTRAADAQLASSSPVVGATTSFTGEPSGSSSAGAPSTRSASGYTDSERIVVAEEIGRFLRACLRGDHRGESGRQKINLPSKVYILCRDIRGRSYNPVQIHRSFASIKPLVREGAVCGDSIFVGLPTLWEAKICVRAAGLEWPADDRA